MPKNKLKRYTGAEVAQPKSIAEQLLAGTKLGNLLYGKQETYKDGDNQERKDASFKESANGQLVQRMGETAKDAGGLVATGLAFGNPLTASNAMAPLIAGSQAYWIGHGINDGAQRIENIGEGVKNFVEDPSWQNAGAVVKEVPMLALDVVGALPVAKTATTVAKQMVKSTPKYTPAEQVVITQPTTSKLTEAERLGIPKGERNQPAKAPTKNQTYKKTTNLESDEDYLEDIEAIQQGFLGKTFLDSEHEALLDWFNSPQYKERLVKQGFSEEQINNLLSNIKDKLSRKNLKYAVDLNSIREWGIGSGGALKIDPQLYPAYEAMTNGNIKIGGQPINWSLIQLKKGVDLDEMVPHEVGGHHLESLVAEFNAPYTSQQITDMGKKAAISSGLPEGYYPSWWETRARALTIAKQMREAGWNPNSPEQVNVWLNKHLLKDNNTNVVQGALYYDRPRFVKAVATGLKQGGKIENPDR